MKKNNKDKENQWKARQESIYCRKREEKLKQVYRLIVEEIILEERRDGIERKNDNQIDIFRNHKKAQ